MIGTNRRNFITAQNTQCESLNRFMQGYSWCEITGATGPDAGNVNRKLKVIRNWSSGTIELDVVDVYGIECYFPLAPTVVSNLQIII